MKKALKIITLIAGILLIGVVVISIKHKQSIQTPVALSPGGMPPPTIGPSSLVYKGPRPTSYSLKEYSDQENKFSIRYPDYMTVTDKFGTRYFQMKSDNKDFEYRPDLEIISNEQKQTIAKLVDNTKKGRFYDYKGIITIAGHQAVAETLSPDVSSDAADDGTVLFMPVGNRTFFIHVWNSYGMDILKTIKILK